MCSSDLATAAVGALRAAYRNEALHGGDFHQMAERAFRLLDRGLLGQGR